LEPVLRDPAAGLGVPHPEHVLVARRPPAIRRAAAVGRRPPHGGGSGAVNVHRSRVHAVASLTPIYKHSTPKLVPTMRIYT